MARSRTVRRTPDFRVIIGDQDISGNVTDIQVTKALASPAGSWTISTSRKVDYRAFPPNTPTKIELLGERSMGFIPVCLGLTDRVGDTFKSSLEGKPSGAYRIQGRDLGKLLVTHAIAFDPLIADSLDANITALGFGLKISGTAQVVVKSLYQVGFIKKSFAEEMIRANDQQRLGGPNVGISERLNNAAFQLGLSSGTNGGITQSLLDSVLERLNGPLLQMNLSADFLNLAGQITPDFRETVGFKDDFTVLGETGSMWNVLLRNADCPWNELYTVTERDGRYVLRLRPTPFGDDGRLATPPLSSSVPVHDIQGAEILDEDLGVSDHERVNFVVVQPIMNLLNSDVLRLSAGAWRKDALSIKRNGFSPLIQSTPYVAKGNVEDQIKLRTTQLWNWFGRNHTYRTGTIQIKGRTDIVVGEGVRYGGYEYYVEATAHRFVYPHSYMTTLRLTRGQPMA